MLNCVCTVLTVCSFMVLDYAWKSYNVTVMKRFKAAYVKCLKKIFGFARLDSFTAMFYELGLPTFKTILHNAKCNFENCIELHVNALVRQVYDICLTNYSLFHFIFLFFFVSLYVVLFYGL